MVSDYAEEPLAVVAGGACNKKDLCSPCGGFGRANAVLTLLSECSSGLPDVEGIAAPNLVGQTVYTFFFLNIDKSGKSSKIDGYEGYWVIYPLSTVLEGRKGNT